MSTATPTSPTSRASAMPVPREGADANARDGAETASLPVVFPETGTAP